jgi:hypothetical protein
MIVAEVEPYLRVNGIVFDRAFMEKILPDVSDMAEFTRELDCFATRGPDGGERRSSSRTTHNLLS